MFLTTLLLLILLLLLIYIFLTWNFDHWRMLGVNGPRPMPLLGNVPSLITQKQHIADDLNDIYREFKKTDRYVGVYLMRIPQLLILDPVLVHDIFVNAFNHFHDNDAAKWVDRQRDQLITKNPFILTGREWREQRALITPGLSPARVKLAYVTMQKVGQKLCRFIEQQIERGDSEGLCGKDLAMRYTCETLADCVLGIQARSFTPSPIPIAAYVRSFAEDNSFFMLYQFITGLFPKLIHYYKAKFISAKCEKFFVKLMTEAYDLRSSLQHSSDRQDFLNYLLSLRDKEQLSSLELASHAMTFLIDGLDTTAAVISHCLLLLARDQLAQQRLRQEILENCSEKGELTFERLNELEYLDACLHETIRIFPPGHIFTKTCTKPYEFTNKNGQKLQIKIGGTLIIPAYSLHRDPDFYPDPDEFKPERFLKPHGRSVKHFRDAGMFLGFGDGPRMCMGMRFALVQTKSAIAAVIQHFKVTLNAKTKENNQLDPKQFLAIHDGGTFLDFQRI